VGVAFVVVAGVGGILVGLVSANVNLAAHGAGALLLGMAAWGAQRGVAAFSLLCGVVGRLPACCISAGATLGWAPAAWSTSPSTR